MSTTTPRLSLLKSAPTEVADVVVSIDNAFDILDAAAGLQPVTAFPGSPFTGKMIQRTDQGDKPYFYQATAGRFANIPFDTFFVRKLADQTVNNSATLVNDAELVVTGLLANATYVWKACIRINSPTATPDFKMTWQVPATSAGFWCPDGLDSAATTDSGSVRMSDAAYGATKSVATISGSVTQALPSGMVIPASTGSLQLQWAQLAATAEATICSQNSWLYVERVA